MPDLLVSGMNQGANCGINVIYSGTVAAALEGAFLGVPSIAVSLHLGKSKPRYDVAAAHAKAIACGARELAAPAAKPWGQVVSYVRAPDGCLIELCTPIGD